MERYRIFPASSCSSAASTASQSSTTAISIRRLTHNGTINANIIAPRVAVIEERRTDVIRTAFAPAFLQPRTLLDERLRLHALLIQRLHDHVKIEVESFLRQRRRMASIRLVQITKRRRQRITATQRTWQRRLEERRQWRSEIR